MASKELKFLKMFNKVDTKMIHNVITSSKELSATQKVNSQNSSPFMLRPFPSVTIAQIPGIILCLAQSVQENSIKNLSLANLQHFVGANEDSLVRFFIQKPSHCHLFCLAFIRFFQECSKTKELLAQISKAQLLPFVTLFSAILQKRRVKKLPKPVKSQQKQINNQIHTIFIALTFATCARFLIQSEQQHIQGKCVQKALIAACLMAQQAQNQAQFQSLRQYLTVSSYLLIFNGTAMRPQNLLQFSLNNDHRIYLGKEHNQQLNSAIVMKFMRFLDVYSKKDNRFSQNLIKIAKNLLTLNINNTILLSLFEVQIELMRVSSVSLLKKQVFEVLIQNHIKRNIAIIDQIFIYILGSGIDLLEDETQRYLLFLAEAGDMKRKERFAIIYYDQYQKSFNKVQEPIINFIFEIYLQLGLNIQKMELMVAKQSLIISKSNISKLHACIRQKNDYRHINILSIILEKRKDNFEVSKKASPHPFICEEWLQNAGSNPQIYKAYTKIIAQTLCGKTLDVEPLMINLHKCIVKVSFGQHSQIQGQYFVRSLEFYSIILKMAQKYDIFEEITFRYMILLQSLLGDKLPLVSYAYFSKNVSKIVRPQSTFLTYLEYLVTLLKNKSSVLLYLQAVLEFQMNLTQLFFEKKLYDISFLARLIQEQFFRLSTYSFESMTVIYQLSLVIKDQSFQEDYLKIMRHWSSMMSRSQCKNLTYFFAFRQIKKIYPFMKQRQLKNPSDRIKNLWNLILNLIDQNENKGQYINFAPNQMIISWKGEQNSKKDIKISGSFLRNPSMELFWHFQIKTTQKVYYVSVKDYKVLIQVEQVKQVNRQIVQFRQTLKQNKVIEMKKRPQSIQFMLKLENQTKKTVFQFSIMEKLLYTLHFDGNIESITLQCKNNAILKQIQITDFNQNAQISQISEHIHYLNQWQIKICQLKKYYLHDFQDKFDFSHAYCCIGQMLKNFSHITIPFAYDIFIRLSTRLIKFIHNNKNRTQLMQMMLQVFNTVESKYSSLKGRNKALTPIIQIQNIQLYGRQLYYLFTTALLPYTFWNNFSQKTKREMVEQLKKLITVQSFRQIQNSQLTFFNQSLEICLEDDYFYEICDLILNVHQFNEILTMKFNKFILMAKESSIYSNYFNSFLDKNLKYLNIQNEKFVQNRLRCKFLIIDSQRIKQIFTFCTVPSKIDILHYLSQNPSFDSKGRPNSLHLIKQLMQRIELNQKYELMPWLIIEVKQLITKLKMKTFQQTTYNFRVNYLHLELLLLNRNACHEDQKDQIERFVLDLLKILRNDMKVEKYKNELQNFIISNMYLDYLLDILKELLGKGNNINKVEKSINLQIYELSIDMITKFQKRSFLQFLIKYRYKCSQQGKLLKALIDNQQFKSLKLSHFSIFLQFIFEVLILLQQKFIFSQQQADSIVSSITEYIQYILHTLDNKTKISKSLFYSFPHIFGHKEGMKDINKIIKRMNRACEKVQFLQLRGGVYFKCMLIIIKMMKLRINLDYSNLAEYFIFGPKKMGKLNNSNEQNQLFSIRQRSLAQSYMLDAAEQHKLYFNKQDSPYSNQNQEVDLNTYIPDYFLMNLAEYLQDKAQIIDSQLLQKYNNIFVLGSSNQKISRDFLLSNNENGQIHNYEDITRIIQQEGERSSSEASSPVITLQRIPSTPQKSEKNNDIPVQLLFHSERDVDFYGSPRKSSQRKKTADFTSEHKKRTQILQLIKEDYRNWYKNQTSKKIPSYFSEKAKQIRVIELLHTHFVLKNSLFMSKISTASKIKEKYDTFNKIYNSKLEQQIKQKLGSQALQDKIRKVKKIHPYTSSKSPVLNIIQNCFGFMTSPITVKITKTDYRIKRLKSQQSMNQRFYLHSKESQQSNGITNQQSIESPAHSLGRISSLTEQVMQVQEQQTYITKQKPYCQLITREGAYFCQYHLENACLVLHSKIQRHICQNLWYLKLGTPDDNLIHSQIKLQIYPQDVHEIFFRRFNQITNNSLQFFMKNGTSKFISFYRRQSLSTLIKHLEKVFKGVKIIKDPIKQFEDAKFSQRWIEGHISNFDYLMLLNKYSGRSYNDLNQYYVFPWILKDYISDKIDLTNPDIYRDLDKPIGALNPEKLRRYKEKYRSESHNSERCLYGSHYSASLIIFYYLVRLEPFSSLHRQMQKGTWDVADRLFNSIQHVWESLVSETSSSDIKQCTPEFYYLPAFLRNIGNIDLGQKQCGTDVGDVELPPWAQNAEQFIITLRAALESDYVSENLHSWIDLIFGKHQNSEQKHNIFHPYSYSDPEVLSKINSKNHKQLDGIICQISYFGQCPIQLFRKEHKPKKCWIDMRPKSIKSIQTGGNSESTSSQKFWGEASILNGWKVDNIVSENNDFIVQLKHITRNEKQLMIISAFATKSILKQSVQTLVPYKKIEQKQSSQIKITINSNKQVMIGKEFLVDLDFKFNFQHTQVNQLWIACFGVKGLKIFNWQLQQSWSWEVDQVLQVSLEPTRLIFSIPSGKLYFYSFLEKKLQQIVVFKDVYDMKIKVMCLPRLPARQKNQITYKILCIGDGTRVSIVSYTFQQIMNYTSQSRCSKVE